jgi:DNA-directed RNA polymerase beta subunit
LARPDVYRERMTLFDAGVDQIAPQKLINPKSLSAVVRDFFGRSQLSRSWTRRTRFPNLPTNGVSPRWGRAD